MEHTVSLFINEMNIPTGCIDVRRENQKKLSWLDFLVILTPKSKLLDGVILSPVEQDAFPQVINISQPDKPAVTIPRKTNEKDSYYSGE